MDAIVNFFTGQQYARWALAQGEAPGCAEFLELIRELNKTLHFIHCNLDLDGGRFDLGITGNSVTPLARLNGMAPAARVGLSESNYLLDSGRWDFDWRINAEVCARWLALVQGGEPPPPPRYLPMSCVRAIQETIGVGHLSYQTPDEFHYWLLAHHGKRIES